ncbi:MAG: protein kinase, partial [Deltaproteobacteria bacterium]|nr:protein kinase [Deltaproteobacteria bacterium]
MSSCPDLGALELAPLPSAVSAHVASCPACKLVVDVFSTGLSDPSECVRFDALLAARAEGTLNTAGKNLLHRHLASCADCREVAETLSPIADQGGDHATLPRVDPGAYELGLEVGRGGMGRVLAARDLRVGRPVAVKELLGRAPQLAARFEREARVTARLQHPGIVPIYEIGQWPDGTPFYSMRMVEGRKLMDAIESAQSLADRLALLPSVIAAAEAVAFAHSQRVIHRDLTPSNILVGPYGETVVIDWGLAKDLTEDVPSGDLDADHPADGSGDKLTGVGAIIGTAAYMPPEQAHAIPVDERADVYALGAILYHLLAGAAPYRAKSTRELLRDVRTGPPRPVGELALETPRDLISIVEKAMAREPEARYPSARELTEELKRFQTGRIVEAHDYSSTERLLRFLKKHKGVVSVAAFALVLLGVLSAVAVSRVLRSRTEARDQVRELLVERGRVELLAGFPSRALAYLDEAAKQGTASPALTFLRSVAFAGVPESVRVLDCAGDVRFVQYSPDGKRIAGACLDRARVWDAATGEVLLDLPVRDRSYNQVMYSRDGTKLVSWGDAGEARIWNAATGDPIAVLAHGGGINVAELSPDDKRVVTFGQDGTAQVWNVATEKRERTIVAKETGLLYLFGAISRDGKQVLTVSMEGEGRGWDIETGDRVGGFDHGGRALLLGGDYSRDGKYSATCGTDRLAKVWDMQHARAAVILGGHTDVVWKCVFSNDGTRLLTSGHDGRVTIWDLATGAAISSVLHGDIVPWGRFSPDGRRFFTVGVDGLVKLWDARSGAMLVSFDSLGGKDAHFSPDGRHLAAQRGDGRIQIWKTPEQRPTLSPEVGTKIDLVSSDGMRAAVTAADGTVALYNTATGAHIAHPPIRAPLAMSETHLAGTTPAGVALIEL